MKARWIRLNASEQRIWEAAYAAAFVRSFYDEILSRHQAPGGISGAFDATLESDHAEEAESVADSAVSQLRFYRTQRGAPVQVDAFFIPKESP